MNAEIVVKKNTTLLIENYADNIHRIINDMCSLSLINITLLNVGKQYQKHSSHMCLSSSQKIDFTDYLFCMSHIKNAGV